MRIGEKEFDTANQTYIMGILNVTPDSFSDGGKWNQLDRALKHTEDMIEHGASIIDVGGESNRAGYTLLTDDEEMERVVPVIEAIRKRFDIPVSLDTYKSQVALAGIKAGADMINDIWGLKYDTKMASVIKEAGCTCCLMHNRRETVYQDYFKDVISDLEETLEIAERAGIPYSNICLDPGVGFAKSYEQNLQIIQKLEVLHTFGLPILLGTSRKSVIGLTLDLPSEQRVEGTLATTVVAVMKGASFVRVHDVEANRRAIVMAEAIRNA